MDAARQPSPPLAPRRPETLVVHGDTRTDDWAWLRNRDDPEVLAHLRAEQTYTEAATSALAPLVDRLFGEIRSRIVETDLSVPVAKGDWWYYQRTVEGLDYPVFCRAPRLSEDDQPPLPADPQALRPDENRLPPSHGQPSRPGDDPPRLPADLQPPAGGSTGAPPPLAFFGEQVLLDQNTLVEAGAYLAIGDLVVSPAHELLAYSIDRAGDERFELHVRRVVPAANPPVGDTPAADPLADECIMGTSYGVAWADDCTLFYTRPDAANRPYQLWRHQVGTASSADVLVHQEDDERFHLGVSRTKDARYVLLELHSKVTSEIRALPCDQPAGDFAVVIPRRHGVECSVDHIHDAFVVVTNDGAENFRIMALDDTTVGSGATGDQLPPWRELIGARDDTRVDGVDVFDRHLVVYERSDASARIRVVPLGDGALPLDGPLDPGWLVPCPDTPSTAWGGANPEAHSRQLRYEYSSLVCPRSVYDLDMETGKAVLRRRQPVLGGFDPTSYRSERLWATADDGTAIPVSVVRHVDTPVDGTAACLLYGYGAYEHSIDPVFSSMRLSLLDRGVVFAIAHVRGGGELGRRWYEAGKLLAKATSCTDFVACADMLVHEGLSAPDRLVARGASAGGLLVGGAMNMAPDRFRAVVAEVPFVDCLTTMLDDTLPLTVIERDEWGDPLADPDVYRAMRAYSPYDNVCPAHYPDVLATAGLHDPRVGYWEPAKWVQRLRQASPSSRILLRVEMQAGHGGPSGRYDMWREEAFVLAFVLASVGITD